ncbi:hypothetical protein ABS71_20240 [bacterium SCN 62-11]|nr:MAG: hypothetical protein ABS71_20240 [bacterium SCN 62-11]
MSVKQGLGPSSVGSLHGQTAKAGRHDRTTQGSQQQNQVSPVFDHDVVEQQDPLLPQLFHLGRVHPAHQVRLQILGGEDPKAQMGPVQTIGHILLREMKGAWIGPVGQGSHRWRVRLHQRADLQRLRRQISKLSRVAKLTQAQ